MPKCIQAMWLLLAFSVCLSSCVCSSDWHQALGNWPTGFPDHYDEDWSHQTFPVHRLPPQVQLIHMLTTSLFKALTTWEWLTSLTLISAPSVPSFQSLPEDVLSKLADVLEEVTIPEHFSIISTRSRTNSICSCHLFLHLTNTNRKKHSVQ